MSESRFKQRLAEMDSGRFEDLVHELVRLDWPQAEKLAAPDGGADTLVPGTAAGLPRVFQAKHYPGRITAAHWRECVDSLETAVSAHAPARFTLVLPRNMTNPQRQRFTQVLVGRHPKVIVDYWGLRDLERRLARADEVIEEFFGPQAAGLARRVLREAEDAVRVSSLSDVVAREREVVDFLDGRDVHFRHQVSGGNRELPKPRWDPAPYLIMGLQGPGELETRVAAWPRDRQTALPLVHFLDDAARTKARESLMLGQRARMTEGVEIRLCAPQMLRQALGDPAAGLELAMLELAPGTAIPADLRVPTAAQATPWELDLYPVPPPADAPAGSTVLAGRRGALEVEISFDPNTQMPSAAVAPHLGQSARENLDALEFFHAWAEGECLELRFGKGSLIQLDRGPNEEALAFLEAWRSLCSALVIIEQELSVEFEVPDGVRPHEVEAATIAAGLIGGARATMIWDVPPVGSLPVPVGAGLCPFTVSVFGQQIALGPVSWRAALVLRPPLAIEAVAIPALLVQMTRESPTPEDAPGLSEGARIRGAVASRTASARGSAA